MKTTKLTITLLLLMFAINISFSQNQNFKHGLLVGINKSNQDGLETKAYDKNNTERVYEIPNNHEEKWGLKAGYYINYSFNKYVSINVETSVDWSRLKIKYTRMNSFIQSGIVYSKYEGGLDLSDVSINVPIDFHLKSFKNMYMISGLNFKFSLDDENEWRYNEHILYDKENDLPVTSFIVLPETTENIASRQFNCALRLGFGIKRSDGRIGLETIIKRELFDYIEDPAFKKVYLEFNLKIDLNKKVKTE